MAPPSSDPMYDPSMFQTLYAQIGMLHVRTQMLSVENENLRAALDTIQQQQTATEPTAGGQP